MNERALAAEFAGTFTLVLAICGSAILGGGAAAGYVATAMAAGIAILVMSYAVGHASGGHFNPAVTLGLVAGGRFKTFDAIGYILAQVLGALAAVFLLQIVLSGAPTGAAFKPGGFLAVANTFGAGRYSMVSSVLFECVSTALFLMVIMGATSKSAPAGFGPIAIGFAFGLLYLVAGPVLNASLNPARSTATAVLTGGSPLLDLWVFWVAPIVGAVIGGSISRWLHNE
jgi:aquaporin Z